jgi:hypothetical protein
MRLLRIDPIGSLMQLCPVLLLVGLLGLLSHAHLARLREYPSNEHRPSAVLTDQDGSDDADSITHPAKFLFVTPDGSFPCGLTEFVALPERIPVTQTPADLAFLLSSHFVYTQLTASAL